MLWLFVAVAIDCSFCQPTNSFTENPAAKEPQELVEYDYSQPEEEEPETSSTAEPEEGTWIGTGHWGSP